MMPRAKPKKKSEGSHAQGGFVAERGVRFVEVEYGVVSALR
ncbi:hypothetical protein AM1_5298 [Acaryochloris marina MBIC11017]|uniref:Uncharacterized protein n=1 Tax=Acaryochloris marina (strain MBIC 11017) TaxID=329726 RepID=B0CAQ5_ACAM1|nr:hypothetical protein AM1_5298 [Acaryochloris marina MBIC11017]